MPDWGAGVPGFSRSFFAMAITFFPVQPACSYCSERPGSRSATSSLSRRAAIPESVAQINVFLSIFVGVQGSRRADRVRRLFHSASYVADLGMEQNAIMPKLQTELKVLVFQPGGFFDSALKHPKSTNAVDYCLFYGSLICQRHVR